MPEKKCELRRVSVAGHEGFEIVTVPGFLLGDDDMLDGGPGIIWGGRASLGCTATRVQKYQRQSTKENDADKQLDVHRSLRNLKRALVSHGGNATAQQFRRREEEERECRVMRSPKALFQGPPRNMRAGTSQDRS